MFRSLSTGMTMSFIDVEFTQWSVDGICLQVVKPGNEVVYYPLCNVESFRELRAVEA